MAASGCHAVVLATPSGHLRPPSGHLRPLAATRVAASGCKWLQVAAGDKRMLAATCGHLRPLEWLQVAAISKIKLRASCVLNAKFVANEKKPAIHCNSKKQLKQLAPRFASRVSQSQPLPLAFLPIPSHPKHCRATKWKAHYGGSCW